MSENPPPPSSSHQQKLVSVTMDVKRLTSHEVVSNRIEADAMRVYAADVKQLTEVQPTQFDDELILGPGLRADGPVTLGTKEGDVFKEFVLIQGNEIALDTNELQVTGPTRMQTTFGSGQDALQVNGASSFDGNVVMEYDAHVKGTLDVTDEQASAMVRHATITEHLDTQGEATFQDRVTFQNTDGNQNFTEATIEGSQFSGNAATASQFENPPEISIGGDYLSADPFTLTGNENISITLQPSDNNAGDIVFSNLDQTITSQKTIEDHNVVFNPPGQYGIEGGWSERWKNQLRLRLGGDLEGEVHFDGREGETGVTLDARIRQSFGQVPNVRLYVSSAEGSDSNPGNTPNFPVRTIKRAAELAQEYVERRNGKFFNFSKINFPAMAYQNPGGGAYEAAADTIWENREGLVASMSQYLEDTYPTLADTETTVPGFEKVRDICPRDARFLIEAVCSDLTYGKPMNMARAAARYFSQFKRPTGSGEGGMTRSGENRLVLPPDQRNATIDTWEYLRDQMKALPNITSTTVQDMIDALFEGFVKTVTDPLPFQTNFSFEARMNEAFGSGSVLADLIENADNFFDELGQTDTFLNKWIQSQVKPYIENLNLTSNFDEEDVRDILLATAMDLKQGSIEYSGKNLNKYFVNNLNQLEESELRPIALALQYTEQIVIDDAIPRENITQAELQAFRRLMEGVYTTLQFPTTFAPTPVTIFVTSGVYREETPIYLAPNVSVVGDSLRSVLVYGDKAKGADRRDFFHCNTGVYVFNLRFRDVREPGFCAAFPAALVDVNVSGDEQKDENEPVETGERRYFQVQGPNPNQPNEAEVIFSYPGYSKFNRPKVYVDEPRDSNTIVEEIIVTDPGSGYTEAVITNALANIKIRDIRERANLKRNSLTDEIEMDAFQMEAYYDEDDPNPAWEPGTRYPAIPDGRADFDITVTNGSISAITLKTDAVTNRLKHGKGYRGQAAFLELPPPDNNGRRARAIVIMKSDYAEMSVPEDGIDEHGRITKVTIDYPGSGYTDVSKPWISIPPPTDLQPYVNASPYIQNCSNLSGPFDQNGNLIPKTLPLPFDINDVYGDNTTQVNPNGAGGGIRIDGACVAPRSPVPSFVTDAFTQLNQGGIGFLLINRGYAQFVSTFGLFCSTHVKALGGSFANISNTVTDFGLESMHARGYWPVPYATVDIIPPRRIQENQQGVKEYVYVTDYPMELDSGVFNPSLDSEEAHGVFVPNEGYRSEVSVDASASFWGAGYDAIAELPGTYYVALEIDPPPSQNNGNVTARFHSVDDEYQAWIGSAWVDFQVDADGRWVRKDNSEEITDRTTRVRTLTRIAPENLQPGGGEILALSLAQDYAKGDDRDEADRDTFTGSGYKEIPNVTVYLLEEDAQGIRTLVEPLPQEITRQIDVRMNLTRVTPIVVKLDDDLVARLVRPKFMSVCRINGVWHTIRGVTRVASQDLSDTSGFEPGEYALSLFPAVNWVDEIKLEFYDASYISTNSHAMEYVGSGITYNALPEYGGVPNSASEVVEYSPGRVFFTTQDQLGNTRIGKEFSVDQLSGRVSINTDQFNLAGLSSIGPFRNDDGETVGVQLRSVSNDPNLNSSMPGNTVPTQEAVLSYFQRFLIPNPDQQNRTLQSRLVNNVLRMVWEPQQAAHLTGTLRNTKGVEEDNVIPLSLYTEELAADTSVTTQALTAATVTTDSLTVNENLVAQHIGNSQSEIRGRWYGSSMGGASGRLSGIPIAYTCQVNTGSVRRLSYGGEASNESPGVRMPRSGAVVFVTVQGVHGVQMLVNDTNAANGTFSQNSSQETDIPFVSGNQIRFETVTDPSQPVVVSFYVIFA